MTLTPIATLHPQPNGTVTRSGPDGQVDSCTPSGQLEKRPAGTAGPWECAQREGLLLIYQPESPGPQFVFALLP
jgi:hypothetical protein